MNRRTSIFAAVLLALTPLLVAQDPQKQSNPHFPAYIVPAQELIAWSWMQKPQPAPQPLPPPDKSVPQPEPQQRPSTGPETGQSRATQTFTGRIAKEGDRCVLRVSGSTAYELDEQGSVKQFVDKDVRIVGTLDATGHTIHVLKIEFLS